MCAKMQLDQNKLKQSKVDYLCFSKKKSSQPTSVYFLMVVVLAKDMTVQILVFRLLMTIARLCATFYT